MQPERRSRYAKALRDAYTVFERVVAALLMVGMAAVIVLATVAFLRQVGVVTAGIEEGWTYASFQSMFDRVLAAIIALELAHSVQQMAVGKKGLTQVRTVLLIGVLAVVRKLILLEIESTSGAFLVGLAAAILALGISYTLILWIEHRASVGEPPSPGSRED